MTMSTKTAFVMFSLTCIDLLSVVCLAFPIDEVIYYWGSFHRNSLSFSLCFFQSFCLTTFGYYYGIMGFVFIGSWKVNHCLFGSFFFSLYFFLSFLVIVISIKLNEFFHHPFFFLLIFFPCYISPSRLMWVASMLFKFFTQLIFVILLK